MSKTRIVIIAIFVVAGSIRLVDSLRPINQSSWREADLGSISRNFVREGLNPMYPRIDWRGSGRGFAEMELPLYPWITAMSYEVFGEKDVIGRLWSLAFSFGTLFFFFRLAREYLDRIFLIAATAFFAFNPLIVEVSTSIQPEGLTIFAYVGAVYYFLRWLRTEVGSDFWLATLLTALTLLAKATAGHIGILFGVLLIQKYGLSVVKQSRVWLFGLIAVVPAAAWYIHAKGLWTAYGNSLGVSNEYHWIGLDFFTNPYFITGILRNEVVYAWTLFGLIVAAFGLIYGFRERLAQISLIWLASVFVLYLAAARTTADDWANYYHIFTVPAAALLFGFGLKKAWDFLLDSADTFSQRSLVGNLFLLGIGLVVFFAGLATFAVEARNVRGRVLEHRVADESYQYAGELKPKLVTPGLILVSGGNCFDADGYRVAYNASFMFYWLDRKGSNICVEDQSIEKVREIAASGTKYFIAQRTALKSNAGFETSLRNEFAVVDENETYVVLDITKNK